MAAVVVVLWASEKHAALGAMGVGLAVWLAASGLIELARRIGLGRMSLGDSLRRAAGLPRASYGMTVAHLGLAIAVAGVTGGALWETESIQIMKPGEQVTVAGYDITFVGVEDVRGPNYLAERGTFTVARDGERIAIMQPEKRRYVVSRQDTTEAAIRTNGIYDLYLVLGESNGKGGWATRFYHKPLVPWLWIGAMVMVLGGLISLSDRRLRVGAPSRRSKRGQGAATAPAAAE